MADRSAFPPGPGRLATLEFLANSVLPNGFRRFITFFGGMAAYGPVASWRIGARRFFFLSDPALIEEALVTRGRDYVKSRGVKRLRRLLGNGLLGSEGAFHLRQRRMMQPAFHRERIAKYGAAMVAAARAQAAAWEDGAPVAIDAAMIHLTLTIAAETLFTSDVASDVDDVRAALTQAMRTFPESMTVYGELLDAIPFSPSTRRFAAARARLDAIVYRMIETRRAAAEPGDDLLAMLLAARDDDGGPMDDEQIRDEAMTIFLAGHETTANALAWTWLLLTDHPAVAQRLHAEIVRVLGDRLPTADDVPSLHYTRDVVAEAMRLYPPAWAIGRRAVRDTTLGPWAVPAGSIVITSQYVVHRDPALWGDPLGFRPERWSAEARALPKFAYFPFGGGTRLCIGESFAWMEAVLIIATIAQRWRFERVDDAPIPLEPLVTLRPKTAIRLRPFAQTAGELVKP
jgi:cytochrome P450